MSKEEDDNGVLVPGNVEKTTQLQEKEGQTEKEDEEKENVEVAEGEEFDVLPLKKREEKQQEEVLTKAMKTPKRPKVFKMKPSLRNQQKEKYLANIAKQLDMQSAQIDKVMRM